MDHAAAQHDLSGLAIGQFGQGFGQPVLHVPGPGQRHDLGFLGAGDISMQAKAITKS